MTFHHVGVASRDLDADERAFAALGYALEREECVDAIQGVRARFLVGPGPRVELVTDLEAGGRVADFAKRGIKMYHFAYEVDDLEAAGRTLAAGGAKLVAEPVPGSAFGNRLLCFYMLPTMVLIELISKS